ncbi:Putative ParB-like nuclease [Methylobacterium sp. 4-46]|uniref:ParB-like protein n=1 Tax=unclassified Methylobacterium TaxID=2615210 RepID=UPI000152C60C|nr:MULTISPECIES: ParB-like protein [Methylobacterium]ACA18610.1 Putative ParB-like nuclease [Methylobacterium sp. 4-46]WFT77891.1 ParB-like protein [Methylobacterium nodulans]
MALPEPLLKQVRVKDLRPTQITVGFREVEAKREHWRGQDPDERAKFLGSHMIPTLIGPKAHHYILDHHHLARALFLEQVETVMVTEVADLHHLDKADFWTVCDHKAWVHPYDAEGVRVGFKAIPKSLADLEDDPYRSLAGALRRKGGFAKETTPFSEFLWADFLRRRIEKRRLREDFGAALGEAMACAKSPEAHYLPGWCGPSET